MEMLTPDKEEFISYINDFDNDVDNKLKKILKLKKEKVDNSIYSYGFRTPEGILKRNAQLIDNLLYKIIQCAGRTILIKNNKLALLAKSLESHDLQRTLKKGFVLVKQDSKFILRSEDFNKSLPASLKFYDGEVNIKGRE